MKRDHLKKMQVLEANYLTGYMQCLAITTIDLHPKGAFLKSNQFGYISRPAIKHGLLFDTRIEFQGSLPHLIQLEAINVKIKKQPFASLIWIGSLLMIAGVIFTISSDVMRRKRS